MLPAIIFLFSHTQKIENKKDTNELINNSIYFTNILLILFITL